MEILLTLSLLYLLLIVGIQGHGMILDPIGRSSRWRTNSSAPTNFDDNQNFCGGFGVQWYSYSGSCGVCGDSFGDPEPRANELGGKYGEGVIVKSYKKVIKTDVNFRITANHLGYVYFNLCNLDEFGKETEECFTKNRLRLADGSDKLYVGRKIGSITTTISFPENLSCNHCVLRWNYKAGNNWGICKSGVGANGCGPQENFKSCADISINAVNNVGFAEDDEVEVPIEI